jgi:hypothetical protein
MSEILVTAGVVALFAAIIGGGLKAYGIEVPLFAQWPRQLMLGALGASFLYLGIAQIGSADDSPQDSEAGEGHSNENAKTQPEVSTDIDLDSEPKSDFDRAAVGTITQQIQIDLDYLGYAVGVWDGYAGPVTIKSLKTFQESVGLPPSGMPNKETINALKTAVHKRRSEFAAEGR